MLKMSPNGGGKGKREGAMQQGFVLSGKASTVFRLIEIKAKREAELKNARKPRAGK